MSITLNQRILCPFCQTKNAIGAIKVIKNLVPLPGALIFEKGADGGDKEVRQRDYFCPDCEKILVCDTNGQGNLVLQNGATME